MKKDWHKTGIVLETAVLVALLAFCIRFAHGVQAFDIPWISGLWREPITVELIFSDAELDCETGENGEMSCDVLSPRLGMFEVFFPEDTYASVSGWPAFIDIRDTTGYAGVRVAGASPGTGGMAVTLPRPKGNAGTRICVRDFVGAGYVFPEDPCHTKRGQEVLKLYPADGTGSYLFTLSDGKVRQVSFDAESVTVRGLSDPVLDFNFNRQPIAVDDVIGVPEDGSVMFSPLINDVDEDGDVLRIVDVEDPRYGTVFFEGGMLRYKTKKDWSGTDFLSYTVTDGEFTVRARITVQVKNVDDAPETLEDVCITEEDDVCTIDPLANDIDHDQEVNTLHAVGMPRFGSAVVDGDVIRYTPRKDWNGEDSFTYEVAASGGESYAEGVVRVIVFPVNDRPAAQPTGFRGKEDEEITGQLRGTDIDGDDLYFMLASRPSLGDVVIEGDGRFVYTPRKDKNGEDLFEFFVTDGNMHSEPAVVRLTLEPVMDLHELFDL